LSCLNILKTTGKDLTEPQARFAFEAQLSLRNEYGGPISLYRSLDFTFAEAKGQVIGVLIHYESEQHGTWVLTAYVDPPYRGGGVLRKMLDSIEGPLALNTVTTNVGMQAAMESIGFKKYQIEYRREANATS
jgi:GNAT superfamily N-acetyltransferase